MHFKDNRTFKNPGAASGGTNSLAGVAHIGNRVLLNACVVLLLALVTGYPSWRNAGSGWIQLQPFPGPQFGEVIAKSQLGILSYERGGSVILARGGGESWEYLELLDTLGRPLSLSDSGFYKASLSDLVQANIHFVDPSTGFALLPHPDTPDTWVIYKTTDGGIAWFPRAIVAEPGNQGCTLHLQMITERFGWMRETVGNAYINVLVTTNGGQGWRVIEQDTTVDGADSWNITFVDSLHGWIRGTLDTDFVHVRTFSHRTSDGGITWHDLPNAENSDEKFADSVNGARFIYATKTFEWTSDAGDNWAQFPVRLPFAASDGNYFRWHISTHGAVTAVSAPSQASYGTGRPLCIFATTTNHGSTWVRDSVIIGASCFQPTAIVVFDDSSASTGNVITTTHGKRWAPNRSEIDCGVAFDIFALNRSRAFLCGTYPPGLTPEPVFGMYGTHDDGQHWQRVPTVPIDVRYHGVTDQQHVWIADTSRLFLSNDSGTTFLEIQPLPNHRGRIAGFAFVDSVTVWLFSEFSGVWITSDRGETWSRRKSDDTCALCYSTFGGASMIDNETGWMVTSNFLHTSNGGTTWDTVNVPNHLVQIFGISFPTRLHGYVFGDGPASETTDGGMTWHDAGMNVSDMHWADSAFGWSSNGNITMDGGRTWISRQTYADHYWWTDSSRGWGTSTNQIFLYGKLDSTPSQINSELMPRNADILSNYPNPFSGETSIVLPTGENGVIEGTAVTISLTDLLGRVVYVSTEPVRQGLRGNEVGLKLPAIPDGVLICNMGAGKNHFIHRIVASPAR